MKRLTFLTTILLATSSWAQTEVPDTVAHIIAPDHLVITDDGTATKVEITGTADRPDFHFEYTVTSDTTSSAPAISLPFVGSSLSRRNGSSREVTFFSDLYYGVVLPYHGPAAVRTSQEGGFGNLIGYRYVFGRSGASLGFGFGFGVKKLTVRRGMEAACLTDRFEFIPAPEGASKVRTALTTWNLQVPVYYRQRFHRSLAFKLSVILNYNVTARATTTYILGKDDYSKKVNGLHQRLITPDFMFTLGTLDFGGLYVRWSPVKMFKRAYGPGISTLSFGLSFGF